MYAEGGAARGLYCPDWPALACQYYLDNGNQNNSSILTELWVDANGTHYAENGVESTVTSNLASQPLLRLLDRITVGAIDSTDQVSNSDFAQIVLASAPPTQAQRVEYLRYACAEWGLTHCSIEGAPATGTLCNPAEPHCGFGRECRNGVGVRFGKSASEYVCWDIGCDDYQSGLFECGSTTSRCGTCPACTESCEGKSCGSNGCWGSCNNGSLCTQGQRGCASSADCATGLVCMPSGSGLNECVPEACGHPGLNPCSDPANAGQQTSCGQCPACQSECAGRQCGPAANGCGSCDTSTLSENEYCTPSGQIREQTLYGNMTLPSVPSDGPTTVGTLPGTFSVSDFGQATYQVPLQLPPGRKGIEPNLSLVYNSAEGEGYLGTGWALTGLSAIHRCHKTIAQDGVSAPITYTDTDRFCLDGSRLVLVNENQPYGAGGSMYTTEVDTFTRVELIRTGSSPEPERFEVRTADGKILTYDLRVGGRSPYDSTIARWDTPVDLSQIRTRTWLPTKVRDRFGNTMRIYYRAPAARVDGAAFDQQPELTAPSTALEELANELVREYFPSRIEYTSNGSLEADRSVDFEYAARSEVLSGYSAGVRFERSQLLQRIVAKVQGETMFSYTFRYDEPVDSGIDQHTHVRLTSVEQCARAAIEGTSDLTCKPKTRFDYSQVFSGFEPPVSNGLAAVKTNLSDAFMGRPLVLDIDGNGQDDVLIAFCPNAMNEGPATCPEPHWGIKRNGGPFEDTGIFRRVGRDGDAGIRPKAFVVDYDLDGKDDVIEIHPRSHENFTVLSWKDDRVTTSSAALPTLTRSGAGLPQSLVSDVYVFDADGDGAPDLFTCTPVQSATSSTWEYLWERRMHDRVQSGFSNVVSVITTNGPRCDQGAAFDIDGDNAQELLLNVALLPAAPYDGLESLPPPASNEPLRSGVMWPLTGFVTYNVMPAAPSDAVRTALDINGDGLTDIAEFKEGSQELQLRVWTNTGAGFVLGRGSIDRTGVCLQSYKKFDFLGSGVVVDKNGDGRHDLVVHCGQGVDWVVLKSLGNTFVMENLDTDVTKDGGFVPTDRFFAYDADHDGISDLATLGSVYPRSGTPLERLTVVTNGLGARVAIEYRSLANPDTTATPLYEQADRSGTCARPAYCRHPRSTVVRAHHVWDQAVVPNGPNPLPANTFWYGYGNASADLWGRGDLGFGYRTIIDNLRNLAGRQAFRLLYDNLQRDAATGLYPFAGRPWSEADGVTVAPGRIRVTSVERATPRLLHPTAHSLFAYFFSEKHVVLEQEGENNPVVIKQVEYQREYDTLGNDYAYAEKWADAIDHKNVDDIAIITDYENDLGQWLIRRPSRITVSMHGERDATRVRTIAYAVHQFEGQSLPTNEPEVVTDQPDNAQQRRTHRVLYDDYGNAYSSTLTGNTIDGEQSRETAIVYDESHMFPVEVTHPDGHKVNVRYDQGLGRAIATSEPGRLNELVTRSEIPDGFGRIRQVVTADGSTVSTSYEARTQSGGGRGGLRVRTTRPGDPAEFVELDVLGREVFRSVEGFGDQELVTETKYDAAGFGKPTAISRPHAGMSDPGTTNIEYDALGRITKVTLPGQNPIERCYRWNVACTRDQKQITTCTVFDEHGREAHRVEPAPTAGPVACAMMASSVSSTFPSEAEPTNTGSYVTKRFHYHGSGDLLSIVDAAGHTTRFERDDLGNVTTAASPDSGNWLRQYNAFGELEHETSPGNEDFPSVATEFRYDNLGRLKSRTDLGTGAEGANEVTSFTFDEGMSGGFHGNLAESVSASGVRTRFRYDSYGRIERLERTIPGDNNGQPLVRNTTYDQYGRLERASYEYDSNNSVSALSFRYNYTAAGYLRSITRPNPSASGQETSVWTALTTDAYGQLATASFGNGVATAINYEANTGRLHSLTNLLGATKVQDLVYQYHDDGLVRTRTNGALSTPTVAVYNYDSLKRLTAATTHSGSESGAVLTEEGYQYSNDGNVIQRHWSDTTTGLSRSWDYVYSASRPHAVDHVSDGTSLSGFEYAANGSVRNRTGSLQLPLGVENDARLRPRRITSSGNVVTLDYDAVGTRVRKSSAAADTVYLDEHYSRRRVSATSGFEEHLLIDAGGTVVAEVVRGPAAGTPDVYYLHTDHLGSVDVVTNGAGAVVERRDYEAFGSRRAITGATSAPLRADFTGHELDAELGLINMKARMYDPQLGRFLSPDPLLSDPLTTQGSNPYSYVANSPLNRIDPTGEEGITLGVVAIVIAIGAAVVAGTALAIGAWEGVIGDHIRDWFRSKDTPAPAFNPSREVSGSVSPTVSPEPAATTRQKVSDLAATVGDFLKGVADGYSPATPLIGRTPTVWGHAEAHRNGMIVGSVLGLISDAAAIGTGLAGVAESGGLVVATAGVASPIAVPVAAASAARVVAGAAGYQAHVANLNFAKSLEGGTASGTGPKVGSADAASAGKRFPESVKEAARSESGGKCVFCGQKTGEAAGPTRSEIDHAIPKSRGGDNTINNAQNTCRTCNRAKGAQTTEEFLE